MNRVTPTADKEETSSISSTPSDSPAFARRLGPEMLPLMLTAGQSSADQTPQLSGRAVAVGLAVGTVLCFTNMYFGLQTGWVTMGSIQSAVVGFAVFRFCWPRGGTPFGPHENVVVQSIAVATATMPLAGGFVGIVPALQMLSPPVRLSVAQQLAWCGGLTYFGIFFAVPLRRQTILVEQLRFPSGTATAKLIDTLHARHEGGGRWRVLGWSFGASYCLSLLAYFAPAFANLRPFDWLCLPAASAWHWTVRPSLSYVGQGMIMGQRSALSMLAGALTAWAVLGPMAVSRGWVAATARPAGTPPAAAEAAEGGCAAPPLPEGAINSWEVGAQGWLLWVAMGLMVSEALSSLAVLTARQFLMPPPPSASAAQSGAPGGGEGEAEEGGGGGGGGRGGGGGGGAAAEDGGGDPLEVAPPSQLVPARWWLGGLGASALLCVAIVAPLFSIPAWQLLVSICLSCLLAVLGVRALGQTDLEPVSALGKLSQIAFAVLAPGHLVTNLVAGAIAEAGAMQAGDLMQDLKAGHLLGASPRAQFYAQLIGSSASVLVTVAAFNMYTSAYGCAGEAGWECEQFQAPVAHVWKDMAVLMQQGVAALPPSALAFAKAFALLGVALPLTEAAAGESALGRLLPSGIAFGIGMYVKPDWTLPRVAGSVLEWAWRRRSPRSHERHMLMAASGFVLGEGIASMVTLALKSLRG